MKQNYFKRMLFAGLLLMMRTLSWAYDFELEKIYYNINEDGISVSVAPRDDNSNYYTGYISIPSTVTYDDKTYNVTSISERAFSGSFITGIAIPNSVTSIGPRAFSYCYELNNITIPNSVTEIKEETFYGCSKLRSVKIPSSIESIGNGAFYGCTSLSYVSFESVESMCGISYSSPTSNPCYYAEKVYDGDYSSNLITTLIIPEGVKSIGNYAFYNFPGITSVEIPNSVTSIGNDAFRGCTSIKDVKYANFTSMCNIAYGNEYSNPCYYAEELIVDGIKRNHIIVPDSVTGIGAYAFYGCSSILSIEIPNSVKTIGEQAFFDCTSLGFVDIPNGVTRIEDKTFYGCASLTFLTISDSVTSIGKEAFRQCTSLRILKIPNSVTSIEDYAFFGCTSLDNVEFESTVDSIGNSVFWNCKSLKYAIFSSVEDMCKMSYANESSNPCYYAENLVIDGIKATSIVIPNNVTSINKYAFYNCSGITSVTIPESVISIGSNAFYGCSSITSITIPESMISIGSNAFYGCSDIQNAYFANVESMCKISYANAYSNPCYYAENLFVNYTRSPWLVIPDGVTDIGNYAFYNCSHFTSVEIPNSITSIGPYAFYGCSGIMSINIPDNVTRIGSYAFYGCSSITSIEISDNVTNIDSYAFANCSSLTSINIPENIPLIGIATFYGCSSLTSVKIPDCVTKINNRAFQGCSSLASIEIPNSVTFIGRTVFQDCFSLKSVVCYADNVPELSNNVFRNVPTSDAILYVPASSLEAYNVTNQWKDFGTILPIGTDITRINNINIEDTKKDFDTFYTIDGKQVETPTKGIYIHNGKKILIK